MEPKNKEELLKINNQIDDLNKKKDDLLRVIAKDLKNKFLRDERLKKNGAYAFFIRKTHVSTIYLYKALNYDFSNEKTLKIMDNYLSLKENEKESFFSGFKEEVVKEEKKFELDPKMKDYLFVDKDNYIRIKSEIDKILKDPGLRSIGCSDKKIYISTWVKDYKEIIERSLGKDFVENILDLKIEKEIVYCRKRRIKK